MAIPSLFDIASHIDLAKLRYSHSILMLFDSCLIRNKGAYSEVVVSVVIGLFLALLVAFKWIDHTTMKDLARSTLSGLITLLAFLLTFVLYLRTRHGGRLLGEYLEDIYREYEKYTREYYNFFQGVSEIISKENSSVAEIQEEIDKISKEYTNISVESFGLLNDLFIGTWYRNRWKLLDHLFRRRSFWTKCDSFFLAYLIKDQQKRIDANKEYERIRKLEVLPWPYDISNTLMLQSAVPEITGFTGTTFFFAITSILAPSLGTKLFFFVLFIFMLSLAILAVATLLVRLCRT